MVFDNVGENWKDQDWGYSHLDYHMVHPVSEYRM